MSCFTIKPDFPFICENKGADTVNQLFSQAIYFHGAEKKSQN